MSSARKIEKELKLKKIRRNVIENSIVECEAFVDDDSKTTDEKGLKANATVETVEKDMEILFEIRINESLIKFKELEVSDEKETKSNEASQKVSSESYHI